MCEIKIFMVLPKFRNSTNYDLQTNSSSAESNFVSNKIFTFLLGISIKKLAKFLIQTGLYRAFRQHFTSIFVKNMNFLSVFNKKTSLY